MRRKRQQEMHGSGPMSKDDEAKFLKERSQQIVQDQQKQQERKAREENVKAIHQKRRDEKEAQKQSEKKAKDDLRNKDKPLSAKKPKVEKEKAEKAEKAEAVPKDKGSKTPKKKVQESAPAKVIQSNPQSFGSHAFLIEEFSKRWNYALPSYPPEGYDYSKDLLTRKLHLVSMQDFNRLKAGQNEEAKIDKKKKSEIPEGFQIVYSVEHYPGLYRNTKGEIFDLRPNTPSIIRPSIKTFTEMPKDRLKELLITAYENQIQQLESATHKPYDQNYEQDFLLKELKQNLSKLKK